MKVMRFKLRPRPRRQSENGQSLLEFAVCVPLLLGIAFNTINFAYYWFVILALSAAPRMAAEYASQGGAATGAPNYVSSSPSAAGVCAILADNFGNSILHSAYTCAGNNVQIRVCSSAIGTNSDGSTQCSSYGPSILTLPSVKVDPEQPNFALQQVDIVWTVRPPIPGSAFHLMVPSNLNFRRQVAMRNLY